MAACVHILNILLAALLLTTTLAHALELPGKMRLEKDAYLATQQIYYPGFTIAGAAEPLTILILAIELFFGAGGAAEFWLIALALAALIIAHGIYWFITHPINSYWVKGIAMGASGKSFFGAAGGRSSLKPDADWQAMRDRWEYSHVARAACVTIALAALAAACALV